MSSSPKRRQQNNGTGGGAIGGFPGPRLSFKHVAISMLLCAFLIAFLNVYMNIMATYSVPSLQLDMSPDGDVIGFHQFDLGEDHHHGQPGSKDNQGTNRNQLVATGTRNRQKEKQRQVRGNRLMNEQMAAALIPGSGANADTDGTVSRPAANMDYTGLSDPMRVDVVFKRVQSNPDNNTKHCPGLCTPSGSPQTQLNYVKSLIAQRLRNIPPNTFSVSKENQREYGRSEFNNVKQAVSGMDKTTEKKYAVIWKKVSDWTDPRSLTPQNLSVAQLQPVLAAMQTARIQDAGVPKKGEQLKIAVKMVGEQYALWKPRRFKSYRDVPIGTPYAGPDRHYAEIAAFYVGVTLGLNRVPLAMGRKVNLLREILPIAEPDLNQTFIHDIDKGRWCFYGKCESCTPENAVCADKTTDLLDGALILWTTFSSLLRMRSPWARNYKTKQAVPWEVEQHYCSKVRAHNIFGKAPTYLDLIESSVFDFIIGNADRHTLEFFAGVPNPALLLLDNGKAFGGTPHIDELSILAPLYQCCQLRRSFYRTLLRLSEINYAFLVNKWLKLDPLYPILEDQQLTAINRRLRKALILVAACIEKHGAPYVLKDDKF